MAQAKDESIAKALRQGSAGRKGDGKKRPAEDEVPDLGVPARGKTHEPAPDPLARPVKVPVTPEQEIPWAEPPHPTPPEPAAGRHSPPPATPPRTSPRPHDSDDVPTLGALRPDPRAAHYPAVEAPKAKKRPRSHAAAGLAATGTATQHQPGDPAYKEESRDPLAGTTTGPTPVPDVDRLQRVMGRSGAFRSSERQESPRKVEQTRKQEERVRKRFEERYRELMDTVARSSDDLGYDPGRPVTEVQPPGPGLREVEMVTVMPDRAYIRVVVNEDTNAHEYHVIEPGLDANEEEILFFLRDTLIRTLDGRTMLGHKASQELLLDAVRQAIVDHRILIDEVGARRIEYYLVRDFLGYGPVDVLMRDPMIEDISCDGPGIPVYLFHRRYESIKTNVVFHEDLTLDSFVIRLAQRSGKHISIADPLLDATLPDGSRLQCTLSREVTTRGSSFTIRKFRDDPLTPPDLIRYGTMSPEMAAYFWFTMEHGHSFILAGGTASGKTTSLNAICQFIPPAKKIVSIEDTREINLLHENWIAGVTRSGFGGEYIGGKPAGTIDMYKLLEAALRQRPEYLLVGEVRGPEALTLFQAMATGHAVYSTMHADSATSAVYRLENEPINVPRMMLQTLDLVMIQTQARLGDRMVRRLRDVMEIVGFDPETKELLTNTVFEWDISSDEHRYLGKSYILERIMEAKDMTEREVAEEWQRRVEILDWMLEEGVRNYKDVSRIIASYYRDGQALLEDIRKGRPPRLAPLEVHDGVA